MHNRHLKRILIRGGSLTVQKYLKIKKVNFIFDRGINCHRDQTVYFLTKCKRWMNVVCVLMFFYIVCICLLYLKFSEIRKVSNQSRRHLLGHNKFQNNLFPEFVLQCGFKNILYITPMYIRVSNPNLRQNGVTTPLSSSGVR